MFIFITPMGVKITLVKLLEAQPVETWRLITQAQKTSQMTGATYAAQSEKVHRVMKKFGKAFLSLIFTLFSYDAISESIRTFSCVTDNPLSENVKILVPTNKKCTYRGVKHWKEIYFNDECMTKFKWNLRDFELRFTQLHSDFSDGFSINGVAMWGGLTVLVGINDDNTIKLASMEGYNAEILLNKGVCIEK